MLFRHVISLKFYQSNAVGAASMTRTSSTLRSTTSSQFSTQSETLPSSDLGLLVVCGPSGVGKGTIIERFMSGVPWAKSSFAFTVSHTTRSPRPGEQDGVNYFFTSKDEMEKRIEANGFMEWAKVHGNYYGTSWDALRSVRVSGKRCLLDIDVQGVKNLKQLAGNHAELEQAKFIFIAPPSVDTLVERLTSRGTETSSTLETRVKNSKAEIQYGLDPANFDCVVVNDDLDDAVEKFTQQVARLYQS